MIVVGLSVAIIAATFALLLPRIAGYGEVWHVVSNLSCSCSEPLD
jgi:hypothetical protein